MEEDRSTENPRGDPGLAPFLRKILVETSEPLYRVYHASFQDFLAEKGVGHDTSE
jgi:hypothetical protein